MVLVYSTGEKGQCFVETKSLDGETNLKIKNTQKDIHDRYQGSGGGPAKHDLATLKASIQCEHPNNAIYKFEGNMVIEGYMDQTTKTMKKTISLGPDNLLLRGMNLRNTDKVYGIVVFTGHDTKVMQNSAKAVLKFSKLEKMMNISILVVLALQTFLAFIAAGVGWTWMANNQCGQD